MLTRSIRTFHNSPRKSSGIGTRRLIRNTQQEHNPLQSHAILEAAQRLRQSGLIHRTPLQRCESLSAELGADIFQKLELIQATGSFKLRGATNTLGMLSADERQRGVVTASAGNHGLGVAHAARELGIPATIVVSREASAAKVAALRRYPARVLLEGANYDAAERHARRIERECGLTFVSAYNDPRVIAGQGTIALEILEEFPRAVALLVPVGGGGLISGVALWAKTVAPSIKVIGVQSEATPAMHAALDAVRLVDVPDLPTLADGLAGNIEAESTTFELVQRYVDEVVLVREADIRAAIRFYARELHLIVEGSAAVGLAALLSGRINVSALQGPVVDIVTGGNIASETLKELINNA